MVFSDPLFLFYFLPISLILYFVIPQKGRVCLIALTGAVFYVWGGHQFILLLLGTVAGNFAVGSLIGSKRFGQEGSRRLLILAVSVDLLSLFFWKYAEFGLVQAQGLLRVFGLQSSWTPEIVLPIGISFFTFQCISYLIDIYREDTRPADSVMSFAAYILLFPHLIAGPIVRFADIRSELTAPRKERLDDLQSGAARFLWGLGKKVLIADQVAIISDRIFGLPSSDLSTASAWLGGLTYTIQIYYDFSGYSDMAIGLARMFGFHFKENFERPYASTSITEFWRRWHISLSSWFRDYLYIPLGGNRSGRSLTYRNLGLVFLATGVWHGANWTFVVWGVYHGSLLILERLFRDGGPTAGRARYASRIFTLLLVLIGWIIFRADSIEHALSFITHMFVWESNAVSIQVAEVLTTQRVFWLLIGLAPVLMLGRRSIGTRISSPSVKADLWIRICTLCVWGPVSLIYSLSSTFSPFLYFQF